MTTSRRDFLTMLTAAGGAFVAPRGFCAAIAAERKLRLGVCSDIHISCLKDELWKWRRALEYFRDQKVDAVVVSGDLANRGLISELRDVARTWWEVFPDGKRPDGAPVEKVFVTGNHDPMICDLLQEKYALKNADGTPKQVAKGELAYDLEKAKAEALFFHRETLWPELFHEPYSHFFAKQVKGYWFLGSHWRSSTWPRQDYEAVELPQYLKDHADELGRTKPFFFVQHCHPKGTCHGADAWWPDCGKNTTDVLKDFPNAVCFSGHSHRTLTDLKAIWQGGFTSIGAGSLSYCGSLRSSGKAEEPEGHPWKLDNGHCHSAYVIDVHDGFLAVQPVEIKYLQPTADQIIVPVPVKPDPDFAFAKRMAAKRPPAYARQPKVEIRDVTCKDWKGEPCPMQEVAFAAVPQGDSAFSRVYSYEITMRPKDGSLPIVRAVASAAANMAPKMEPDVVLWHVKPGTFRSAGDYEFEIVPLDSFGTPAKCAKRRIAALGLRIANPPEGWSVDNYVKEGATVRSLVDIAVRTYAKRYDAFVLAAGDRADKKAQKELVNIRKQIARRRPDAKVAVVDTADAAAVEKALDGNADGAEEAKRT